MSTDNPFIQMRKATLTKLTELDWIKVLLDSDFLDKTSRPFEDYPLVEVHQGDFGTEMYQAQTSLRGETDIIVKCYLPQVKGDDGQCDTTACLDLLQDYSYQVMMKIYSFNEDLELGHPPCRGFAFINGMTPIVTEPHLDDTMMGFFLAFSATIINIGGC